MNPNQQAEAFLEHDRAFRLGALDTEGSHPKTESLAETIAASLEDGLHILLSVDDDIAPVGRSVLQSPGFDRLRCAFERAICEKRRIVFTGCGATGRLSILLEACWRRFWRRLPDKLSDLSLDPKGYADLVLSVMAGGDFALIKSVEGFEDFEDFGRRQLRESGVADGDVVVAITEGGETSFVIGTAWEGLDRGAEVFFVYNNPTELLAHEVQRSREVIEESAITKLDLATGPMAIMGSTRMQATTCELLIVGAALEQALLAFLKSALPESQYTALAPPIECYADTFDRLVDGIRQRIDVLSRLTTFEQTLYEQQGLLTYYADGFLLDVLTDTTERSPTFMVPPFRQRDDQRSPQSWAFTKHPSRSTEETWVSILGRSPRGLTWTRKDYEEMKAPPNLLAEPPTLNNAELYKFEIGCVLDEQRSGKGSACIRLLAADECAGPDDRLAYDQGRVLHIGNRVAGDAPDFHVDCDCAASPLELWDHLAVKLVMNTVSTATMCRMNRVIGNCMVWVSPSNKKLIDRGTRLVSRFTGQGYEEACHALFRALEDIDKRRERGEEVPSPVAAAIQQHHETAGHAVIATRSDGP
jgi:N-acetylmuramic acid 6-phosphate etherase